MKEIEAIFRSKVDFSEEEMQLLVSQWNVHKKLKRNEFLIERGQIEHNLYFIKSGSLRIFYSTEQEEVCVGFGYDNTMICSFPSFIKGSPSEHYIQALSPVEMVGISRTNFFKLFEANFKFESCWRQLTEDALIGIINRDTEMMIFNPRERYERLLARSPHIFQFIPRKYIASYLKMKPETLSRLK